MKSIKLALIITLLLAALAVSGADSMARPYPDPANAVTANRGAVNDGSCCADQSVGQRGSCGGWSGGRGAYVAPMTSEQQAKFNAISEEYTKSMNPLRDQVFVKRQELRALQHAATPDVNAVRESAQELIKLNRELADLHREMMTRLQKEVGHVFARQPGGAYRR